MNRKHAAFVAVVGMGLPLLAGCAVLSGRGASAADAEAYRAATIVRDPWNVPFIEAPDEAAAAFALAYAMAEDGMSELEQAYATAFGRVAESNSGAVLPADAPTATLASVDIARAEFAQLPDSVTATWRGFADGLNAFLQQRPSYPLRHFTRFEAWMVYAYARSVVAVQPAAQKAEEDLFSASVTPDHAGGGALFVAASTRLRPYEFDMRVGAAPRFHGFTELGMPVAREGFTDSIAFAAWPPARDSTIAGGRTSDIDAAGIFAQWRALARSRSAAEAAAAAAGPYVVRYAHASGSTNLPTVGAGRAAASRPAAREARAAAAMAEELPWTLERMVALAFDTRVATADDAIAGIVDEWEQVGARNPERAAALDSAIAILREWDRQSAAASPAMSLFAAWFDHHAAIADDGAFTRFRALELAVRERQAYPPRPWSQVNRVMRGGGAGEGHATAGAPARYGVLFAYAQRQSPRVVWGVHFGTGAAASVVSYGQSWAPTSAHWMDQAPLFAAGRVKPVGAVGGALGAPYHPYRGSAETRAQLLP